MARSSFILGLSALLTVSACGGGSRASGRSSAAYRMEVAAPGADFGDDLAASPPPAPEARVARVATTVPVTPAVPGDGPPGHDASDARDTSGPLLIYTAALYMAVFEVRTTQTQLVERARAMGGVLFQQTDDRLVVRVPAARFEEFLAGVGELGDVVHRDISAQDVGEEFRDVAIRIRNLEVTRQRVEALLAQATTVDQALSIQRELERITTDLEALRGRQRFLADHIAFSTITFVFQPRPREALEQPEVFQLPFVWLEQLGLSSLLEVR